MKLFQKILPVFLFALLAVLMIQPARSAETYDAVVYIDNINGSNSNDGLTEATAVKTHR